jgi:hypothetical protein
MEMDGEKLEEGGGRGGYGGGQDNDKAERGGQHDHEVHDDNGRAVSMDPDGDCGTDAAHGGSLRYVATAKSIRWRCHD